MSATSPWFPVRYAGPAARTTLYCLPHAGAGPTAFRGWADTRDERVALGPVQYPGRAARVAEPSETSIRRLAERIAGPLAEHAGAGRYVVFGHSMGALVAFELCRVLRDLGRAPAHLVVSGQSPPQLPHHETALHTLADKDFIEAVIALDGMAPDVLASPTLIDMLVPILRADFAACEQYHFTAGEPLALDLTVLCGEDDPTVDTGRLDAWAELTTGRTTVHTFPGGHFYPAEQLPLVLDVVGGAACRPLETT